MGIDADTVVFVGVPDIARITKRSRQRIAQLLDEQDRPDPVLPDSDALINGYPFWSLDSLLPCLRTAKYPITDAVLKQLGAERSIPRGTVPVGAVEAAEILGGLASSTLRTRIQNRSVAKPLFVLSRNNVWDLDELIVDARVRGFAVDENAVAKWRARNGSGTPPRHEVQLVVTVRLSVPAHNDVAALQRADAHVRSRLLSASDPALDRIRVLDVEVSAHPH